MFENTITISKYFRIPISFSHKWSAINVVYPFLYIILRNLIVNYSHNGIMYQLSKYGSLKTPRSDIEKDNTVNDVNEVQVNHYSL